MDTSESKTGKVTSRMHEPVTGSWVATAILMLPIKLSVRS